MKRTTLTLLLATFVLFSCRKEQQPVVTDNCVAQQANPAGTSYPDGSMTQVSYSKTNCGLLPLSSKNYWIYKDSIYSHGVFARVEFDTLRFSKTYQSNPDNLIWWESSIDIGLPDLLYSNDSAIFQASFRLFAQDPVRDAKKEYGLFEGDSVKYLTSFEDNAAMGRSVKLNTVTHCPAGNFNDCILFEKKAPFFRKDQVIFKPGVGVVKYITEKSPMGSPNMKIEKISTLVQYHLE